jgi:hypothetical protein
MVTQSAPKLPIIAVLTKRKGLLLEKTLTEIHVFDSVQELALELEDERSNDFGEGTWGFYVDSDGRPLRLHLDPTQVNNVLECYATKEGLRAESVKKLVQLARTKQGI